MDRSNKQIDAAADFLRGFVRTHAYRALCFEAPQDALGDIATLALAFEHHADNKAVFLPVAVEGLADADGAWTSAIAAARSAYAERREDGAPLSLLGPAPLEGTPGAAFSVQLHQLVGGVEEPARGLVVVLLLRQAPARAWLDQLRTMLRSTTLGDLRLILCGIGGGGLEAWSREFKAVEILFHRVPPAGDAGPGQRTARDPVSETPNGGIWPRGAKPPPLPGGHRVRREATPTPVLPASSGGDEDAAGRRLGASGAQPDEGEPEDERSLDAAAQQEIQAAALAMRNGEGAEAIRQQTRARDRYLEAGRTKSAIEIELVLAGYLLQLGQPRLAAQTLRSTAITATGAGEYRLAIKASLQRAAAAERDDDLPGALEAYRHAIETSTGVGDAPVLAMEAYWRAGQAALGAGLDLDTIGLWGDAVVYASRLDAKRLHGSQAKPISAELARLLVVHRRYSQAREIERLALEF